tara:strand:- start:596 stop:985 length:390 start_codon:yes stop_codon:yes gene_type:complete
MKKFSVIAVALLFMLPVNAKAEITFRLISPVEVVKSAGDFVLDTGKKVCEGIVTTGFGIGEVVTAPFRANYKKPKVRTYKYRPPRLDWHYNPSRLYEEDFDSNSTFGRNKTQVVPQRVYKYDINRVAKK